jgi:pyruvate,water dikinase
MNRYLFNLRDVDRTKLPLVGGKGANLGELFRIPGIQVPEGFCVSTEAFARVVAGIPSMEERLARLAEVTERDEIRTQSAGIRQLIESAIVPPELRDELAGAVDAHASYAVRSSATAEDLPSASFAGQQDSFLNVTGAEEIVQHLRKCWASLFTERAVTYRAQNGFDHRRVGLAVVVQEMVPATVSGVLFTADPLSGNRKVASIDAAPGLGDALVSGRVTPDLYRVRNGERIECRPAGGGRTLTDEQVGRLEKIGRTIEAHFGRPQDIEWCLAGGTFFIVQSRPITTLFPVPETSDGGNHVYVSVGHQQMMTDAMKPLGLSLFQLTAMRPMPTAGGRLFVDVTTMLASPDRANLLNILGASDPLIRSALETLLARGDFIELAPADAPTPRMIRSHKGMSAADIAAPVAEGPALVTALIAERERSVAALRQAIQDRQGTALFDFILADIVELKRLLTDPRSVAAILAGNHASFWLDDQVNAWLGEKKFADTVARSVPANITSEMGPALLEVAEAIRPYPAVVAFLRGVADERFLERLPGVEGGVAARAAIAGFLDAYGMRGPGEIDLTRERWAEKPSLLIPMLLAGLDRAGPGAAQAVERRRQEAVAQEREIVARLQRLPDGARKAAEIEQMIGVVRTFLPYREYPKYHIVNRYFLYKQALLREAEALVRTNVIRERTDIYYLTFPELHEGVRTRRIDPALIAQRREHQRAFEKLSPPRVLTSDGEMLAGAYRRDDIPAGALAGLAVSSGVVEGRARVVLDPAAAELEDGDILVTTFTDPSWTPLFVSIRGLVTEVGGLMTHGAVIAREYGLPAVVGVEHATQRIRDGQRIRLNGTDGFVELL